MVVCRYFHVKAHYLPTHFNASAAAYFVPLGPPQGVEGCIDCCFRVLWADTCLCLCRMENYGAGKGEVGTNGGVGDFG